MNIIDNIGIHVNVRGLPTFERYRAAASAYYGTDWLGRAWCKYIRPILAPRQHAKRLNEYHIQLYLHRQAFLIAVLSQYSSETEANDET